MNKDPFVFRRLFAAAASATRLVLVSAPAVAVAGIALAGVGSLHGPEARADSALPPAPPPVPSPTGSHADAGGGESTDPPADDSAAEASKEDRREADGRDEDRREDEELDRLEDGDIDEEDRVAIHARDARGSTDVHDESWISLVGLRRELQSGKSDLGGMVVVGLALDRMTAGPTLRVGARERDAERDTSYAASPAGTRLLAAASLAASRGASGATGTESGNFSSALARACVAAALRTAGLDGDERLDSLVARAHASAALPETRLRAMRLWDDANHTTTLATTDGTNYYDAVGANLVLEARLTWRLDRLVYAGDEPTLERVRVERQEARSRLSMHTLEALFAWERARVDASAAVPDTRERIEADLRAAEARATLDVLTGGRFSDWERSP
jgi:hypothetical protein